MIEDLLSDKKKLSARVEELLDTIKDLKHVNEKQKKVVDDRLGVELKKNKDAWVASEKVRREKWEREKVNEIRAQTVKGLEPEIQRILDKNKDEIRRMAELH